MSPKSSVNKSFFSVNKGSLLKSTFWGLGISVFVSLGTFGFNVLIARNLNVIDFATFVAVMTFINLVGLIFSGFQVSVAREIAQDKISKTSRKIDNFTKSLLLFSLVLALLLYSSQLLWNRTIGLSEEMVIVLSLVFPSSAILIILNGRFAGLGRFREQATLSLLLVTLNLLIQIIQVALWGVNLERVIWTQIIVNVLVGLILLFMTNKIASISLVAFSKKNIQTSIIVAIFGFIASFDLLLSPLFLPEDERGHFSAASGISKYLLIFFTMINATIFTSLNRKKAANESSFIVLRNSGVALSGLVISFLLGIWLLGPTVLIFLYGNQYETASSILFFVCLAFVPMVFASWLLQVVYMRISWFPVASLLVVSIICLSYSFMNQMTITTLSFTVFFTGLSICIILAAYLVFLRNTGRWKTYETS